MSDGLQAAIELIKAGQPWRGGQILAQIVIDNPYNEAAWMWLAGIVDTDQKRRDCLTRVLAINPQNQFARKGLSRLTKSAPALLRGDVNPSSKRVSAVSAQPNQEPGQQPADFLDKFSVTHLMGELGYDPLADDTTELLALVEETPSPFSLPGIEQAEQAPVQQPQSLQMPFSAAKTVLRAIKPFGRKQFKVDSPQHPSLVLSIFDYGEGTEESADPRATLLLERLRRKKTGQDGEHGMSVAAKAWLLTSLVALLGVMGVGAVVLWLW